MTKLISLLFLFMFSMSINAKPLLVAAASDLKFALDEIKQLFLQQHPKARIKITYGSSGKFRTQIVNGAPFHVYFSADIAYPNMLKKIGLVNGEVIPYAKGRIVLWSQTISRQNLTLEQLTDKTINRIAIANPQHAPYGKRAKEALQNKRLWTLLQDKLIRADNIAQTAQFALSGNTEVAITALSIALNPKMQAQGHYTLIPEHLHAPLLQGYAVIKQSSYPAETEAFVAFIKSPQGHSILKKYGFLPQ